MVEGKGFHSPVAANLNQPPKLPVSPQHPHPHHQWCQHEKISRDIFKGYQEGIFKRNSQTVAKAAQQIPNFAGRVL